MRTTPVAVLFALLALVASISACSKADPNKLKEWTPSDHTNATQPAAGQVDAKKRAGMPSLEKNGISDVVLATWKQNCITCHGVIGRGDGPQGAVLKPPNLTSPAWQKNAIDSELIFAIKKGRGRMPSFGHLPEETVQGLVKLIRMLNSDSAGSRPASAESKNTEEPSKQSAENDSTAPRGAKSTQSGTYGADTTPR